MGEKDHKGEIDYKNAHKPGCVVRCYEPYEEGNTCSYRWQALKKAREKRLRRIYDSHPNPECHIDAIITKSTTGLGWGYLIEATVESLKKKGLVIDIGKRKSKKGKINLQTKGFVTSFSPYPNRAHHVLPDNCLDKAIKDAVQSAKNSSGAYMTIRVLLMEQKYNLNDKNNMLFLPYTWPPACQIGLPTHRDDHKGYSKKVQTETNNAISRNYNPDDDDHPGPGDIGNMIVALKNVSKTYLSDIISKKKRDKIKSLCDSFKKRDTHKAKANKLSLHNLYK